MSRNTKHHTPKKLVELAILLFIGFFIFVAGLVTQSELTASIVHFDYAIDAWIAPFRSLKDVAQGMLVMTYLGNPEMIIAFQVCIILVIVMVHRKRIAGLFLGGIIIGEAAALFFKNVLARSRPVETIFHVARHGYSFPSGHALLSIVFYGSLGFFLVHVSHTQAHKVLVIIFTALLIFLIGFSRVFLDVHWASDVLGGWLLGGALLSIIIVIFSRIHKHTNGERITDLSHKERTGLALISLALGFFLVLFFVAHLSELRSIL
jgi:undecaprenyl-diphosphatase